jgi:hypothetical protein
LGIPLGIPAGYEIIAGKPVKEGKKEPQRSEVENIQLLRQWSIRMVAASRRNPGDIRFPFQIGGNPAQPPAGRSRVPADADNVVVQLQQTGQEP